MSDSNLSVVTGEFGYTGRYITRRLLALGAPVKTLTTHPDRPNPFGDQVSAVPFDFDDPARLAGKLEGADVLYNTYWVRFARGAVTFDKAVANTAALIRAAESAGLRRVVHISITNASADSPLPYFRGKGLVDQAVRDSTLSHAIIRPTVVFGREDILLNNIAWFLRRFPLFPIFGTGQYGVQPVYVDDVAELAVAAGQRDEDVDLDAVGPETLTYKEMVRALASSVRSRMKLVHVSPGVGLLLSRLMGYALRDVVITRDEVEGLMAGLLVSENPPTGQTRLTAWLEDNAENLGTGYVSEIGRHYR